MSIGREGGRLPWQVLVLLVTVAAATALWSGCGPGETPALKGIAFAGGIDSAPLDAMLDSARKMVYDDSHGVGDYRRLMVGSCLAKTCGYGPHVKLHPVIHAWKHDSVDLARGQWLARLINLDADSYPKFNLAPHDTAYWWVDRRGPGGTWRSVYLSSVHVSFSPSLARKTDSLYHTPHPTGPRWERTLARFVWQDTDEALWVACDKTGCCRTSGEEIY